MAHRELTTELRHRQKQRRAATTILVVLLMLFFAFWYAYSYYRASGADQASADSGATTCRPYDPEAPAPGNTTVNVYNATSKNGLAARTAAELKRRGFLVGEVGNDSSSRKVATAEVRFGPAGKANAQLVVPLGGTGTTQLEDKREGTTVDLVLGTTFSTLAAAPKATGTPMCPAPSGSPTSATAK